MDKLKEECLNKFTIDGSNGKSLACAVSGEKLWEWITNNFTPKVNPVELQVSQPSELLPCPFCGNTPRLEEQKSRRGIKAEIKIRCALLLCGINPETRYCETKETAIKIWNKRASQ